MNNFGLYVRDFSAKVSAVWLILIDLWFKVVQE